MFCVFCPLWASAIHVIALFRSAEYVGVACSPGGASSISQTWIGMNEVLQHINALSLHVYMYMRTLHEQDCGGKTVLKKVAAADFDMLQVQHNPKHLVDLEKQAHCESISEPFETDGVQVALSSTVADSLNSSYRRSFLPSGATTTRCQFHTTTTRPPLARVSFRSL